MTGTAAYVPWAQMPKFSSKISQVWKTTSAPHYIQYIQSNYGNKWNKWTKHTNLECSQTQNGDIDNPILGQICHTGHPTIQPKYTLTEVGYLRLCKIHIQNREGICLQNLQPRWSWGWKWISHNFGIMHLIPGLRQNTLAEYTSGYIVGTFIISDWVEHQSRDNKKHIYTIQRMWLACLLEVVSTKKNTSWQMMWLAC